jgi:tripartite-type tricarboxylate transporter receptor subunit TctC
VHKNLGYDPLKAFVPVGLVMETPQAVSVHPDLPVKTMAELVAYAKANPGKISFGSQGFGVGPHLMLELFKLEAGIKMTHVPYRGTAPMLTALLTGEVQLVIDPTTTSLMHIQSGKIRPLAIAGPSRTKALPDVPTTAEAGLSEALVAVLARRGGAGRHAEGHHRQAQRRVSRSSRRAGNARAAWRTSAPRPRSARRRSSAS